MEENKLTIPEIVDNVRSGKASRRHLMKVLAATGVSAAGIGAVIAAISHTSSATSQASHRQEDELQHIELHSKHLTAQTTGNSTGLSNDYAPHAILEESLFPDPIVGIEAIMARKSMGFAAATSPKIEVVNRFASGNQVTVEWIATGVHTGDLPNLPASNRSYTLRGVTVVIREDSKIVREALYYDKDDLYRQLS